MSLVVEEGPDEVRAEVEATGLTVLGALSLDVPRGRSGDLVAVAVTRLEVALPGSTPEVVRVERLSDRLGRPTMVSGLGLGHHLGPLGSARGFALDFRRRYGDLAELEPSDPAYASTAEYERLLRLREALLLVPSTVLTPLVASAGGVALLAAVGEVRRADEPGSGSRVLLAPITDAVLAGAPLTWALRRFAG